MIDTDTRLVEISRISFALAVSLLAPDLLIVDFNAIPNTLFINFLAVSYRTKASIDCFCRSIAVKDKFQK